MLQLAFFKEEQLVDKIQGAFKEMKESVSVRMEIDEDLQEEVFYVSFEDMKKPTQILSLDKIQSILSSYLKLNFYKSDAMEVGEHGYGYVFFY